jgi:hypothetical protein
MERLTYKVEDYLSGCLYRDRDWIGAGICMTEYKTLWNVYHTVIVLELAVIIFLLAFS